jgi:hypothetical protein
MKLIAPFLAASPAASANASSPFAAPAISSPPVHTFASLVISPAGDRVASVENLESLTCAE